MDYKHTLKIIEGLSDINDIKSVINSVNDNQVVCKTECANILQPYLDMNPNNKVLIAAGWFGMMGSLLDDYEVTVFDMDPKCEQIGKRLYPNIKHITSTIEEFDPAGYGTIICTACEHITDETLNNFLAKRDRGTMVCLQSNDYFSIDEHINCKKNIEEFIHSVDIEVVEHLTTPRSNYNRYTIVGR